jgi:hypothetical protein
MINSSVQNTFRRNSAVSFTAEKNEAPKKLTKTTLPNRNLDSFVSSNTVLPKAKPAGMLAKTLIALSALTGTACGDAEGYEESTPVQITAPEKQIQPIRKTRPLAIAGQAGAAGAENNAETTGALQNTAGAGGSASTTSATTSTAGTAGSTQTTPEGGAAGSSSTTAPQTTPTTPASTAKCDNIYGLTAEDGNKLTRTALAEKLGDYVCDPCANPENADAVHTFASVTEATNTKDANGRTIFKETYTSQKCGCSEPIVSCSATTAAAKGIAPCEGNPETIFKSKTTSTPTQTIREYFKCGAPDVPAKTTITNSLECKPLAKNLIKTAKEAIKKVHV